MEDLKPKFVLIDFENVQPKRLQSLRGSGVRIKVFLGGNQSRVPIATVQAMQSFGNDAEYIKIDGSGHNALDFHIAYYIGRLAAEHPGASFRIVSKDTGFDPLIRHLKTQGITCQRRTIPEPSAKVPNSSTNVGKAGRVIENLKKRDAAKPRTRKTLRSSIKTLFAKLSDPDLDALIDELTSSGVVKISDEGKVSYDLPS